jgi:hypothetical protein
MKDSLFKSLTRRQAYFLAALCFAWISTGPIAATFAFKHLRAPTDLTRDFVAAKVLARGEPLSTLDGDRGNAEAVREGGHRVLILDGSPFHLHPPPASLPMRLLVPLGLRGASIAWLVLSLGLLGVLAWRLGDIFERVTGRLPVARPALFLLLMLWHATLMNVELGQWSIVLAALIAVGFDALERAQPGRGGAWLGATAALKLTPWMLFPFLALRRRRAAVAFAVVFAAALALALPFGGGLDAWMAFERGAGKNVAEWQTWWHNTLSINGLVARLLVGGRFARPLVEAPVAARVIVLAAGLALVFAAFRVTAGPDRPARNGCVFALWSVLIVVLNPLAWTHYALLLVLPAALVFRAAEEPASPLPEGTRAAIRRDLAIAIVGLSIPKETFYFAVTPLPTSPAAAPVGSVHLFAALMLFAAAYRGARGLRSVPAGD